MARMKHEQGLVFYHQNESAKLLVWLLVALILEIGVFRAGMLYERKQINKDIEIQCKILTPGGLK
jgi:hypothetical protein